MLATVEPKTASGRERVGKPSDVSAPEEHPENTSPSKADGSSRSSSARPHARKPWKTKKAEIKGQYRLTLEISLVVVLGLTIALLAAPLQPSEPELDIVLAEQEVVQMEEIQQTQQAEQPPPPPRPAAPVEVANDVVLDDVELDFDASLDLNDEVAAVETPPPPPENAGEEEEVENEVFVIVENMPELIGGVPALQQHVEYPELARRAGIEGRVYVQFIVDENGNPTDPQVIRGIGGGCDEEAVRAIMQHAKFKPGKQRGKPVRVRMSIPINFQLRKSNG